MENTPDYSVPPKKLKPSSQQPTDNAFWKQLGPSTTKSGNIAAPQKKKKKIKKSVNIQLIRMGPQFRPGNPNQKIRPGKPQQNIPPNNPGQQIRPGIPGQQIRPGNPGQQIRPNKPNQNIRPGNPVQKIRPGNIQPWKPTQELLPINPSQIIRPGIPRPKNRQIFAADFSEDIFIENPTTSEVSVAGSAKAKQKFIPLKEVEQSGKMSGIDESKKTPATQVSTPILFVPQQNIKTVVGKNTNKTQQQKILKFQMRMQAMQEEKQRQTKNMIPVVIPQPVAMPTEVVNVGGVQNPYMTGVPNVHGVLNAMGLPNMSGMPIQGNPNLIIMPHPQNTGFPNQLPIGVPNPHQMPLQQMQPMAVPVQQLDIVETVFNIANQGNISFAQPMNTTHVPTTPQKPKVNQAKPWNQVDAYGYNYPKGVPKSFLLQQQQAAANNTVAPDAPIWPSYQPNAMMGQADDSSTGPLMVQTDSQGEVAQPYSPSELYTDLDQSLGLDYEDTDSNELSQSGQKRLSAFRRLGPQTQAKTPKLTISLTVNDDQEVREVVDETEVQEVITPVHLREDIILSTDDTVMKYLKSWPWKRKVVVKRSVTARNSKTVMMLEREQMEEIYEKDTLFVLVSVKGYPPKWKKEQVLDTVLENIRGYSFIPCFIEFNHEECKFLTLRCRSALLNLHKCGFIIRKDNVELIITLGQTEITLNQLDFVPRLILRKRLNTCADSETKLDLSSFTLNDDISHFIYFPLARLNNQTELIQMQSEVAWCYLTDLNLSHNRITSIDGFDLEQVTPKLKHLNLSYNCIENITLLIKCRDLPLKSIHLEGNPLCTDYTDPDYYVRVVRMIFSSVEMIDNIPVRLKGNMPKFIRNYCPPEAKDLVEKFLEIYFPLLDGDIEHRALLQEMYEDFAFMTITYNYKMAFGPIYRCYRTLFQNARHLEEENMDMIRGSNSIIKTLISWPHTEHDPFTFTVDVLHHSDSVTIVRIDGILKLTRESLAEEEHLLSFSRTLVLHTRDYSQYKIQTEMIHWSAPIGKYATSAFSVTAIKTKQMHPKIDCTTDETLQSELLKIFMKLTSMDKKVCERCLEMKKWNLKEALDHFSQMLKLDSLESLTKAAS